MTLFVKHGATYMPKKDENHVVENFLPAGNYVIGVTQTGEMFLEKVDSFSFSGKRYGSITGNATRILNTFADRKTSTGVLLSGEKGSGKSLLAKLVCMEAAEQGIPTIIVNSPWRGTEFNNFIQSITQPAIVLFDEYEKVYDREQQEELLTLLDGVFPTKKMFILTCNDVYRVDQHLLNRPGRIFYSLDFSGIEESFVREYCADNLKNKDHIDKVASMSHLFKAFNFDMLKALVEEMNRYDETPMEAIKMLNIKSDFADIEQEYDIQLFVDGIEVEAYSPAYSPMWEGNPFRFEWIRFPYKTND